MINKNHLYSSSEYIVHKGDGEIQRNGIISSYRVGEKVSENEPRNVAFAFDNAGTLWLLYSQKIQLTEQALLRSVPFDGSTSKVIPLKYRYVSGGLQTTATLFWQTLSTLGGTGCGISLDNNLWKIMGLDDGDTSSGFDGQGNFYFSRGLTKGVIFRVELNDPAHLGETSVIAGCGSELLGVLGQRANRSKFEKIVDFAFSPSGDLYVLPQGGVPNANLIRIAADGIVDHVEKLGQSSYIGPQRITVGKNGSLYILMRDQGQNGYYYTIERRRPSGTIDTLLKARPDGFSVWGGDYGPADQAYTSMVSDFGVDNDDNVFFSQYQAGGETADVCRIRKIDASGFVSTVVGKGCGDLSKSGTGLLTLLPNTSSTVIVSKDGTLLTTPRGGLSVGRPSYAQIFRREEGNPAELVLIDEPQNEMYLFASDGYLRHSETKDLFTNASKSRFTYVSGRLTEVKDAYDNTTRFVRDAAGKLLRIVSPMGLVTGVELDANGYLTKLTTPANSVHQFGYGSGGLMSFYIDPNGHKSTFSFDAITGKLSSDTNAAAAALGRSGITLADSSKNIGGTFMKASTVTTAEGVSTEYLADTKWTGNSSKTLVRLPSGVVNTSEDIHGVSTKIRLARSGVSSDATTYGMEVDQIYAPDQRFGESAPFVAQSTMRTPSRLQKTVNVTKEATLANQQNVFSLTSFKKTTTLNGKAYVTNYTQNDNTWTLTTPMLRKLSVTLNPENDPVLYQRTGIADTHVTYDTMGRVKGLWQDGATDGYRTWEVGYHSTSGYVETLKQSNALPGSTTATQTQTWGYTRDKDGRATTVFLPGGTQFGILYDKNGNVKSVTPPSRDPHVFAFDLADNLKTYDPPYLSGVSPDTTNYLYNLDNQVTSITRPDGSIIDVEYEEGIGRPTTVFVNNTPQIDFDYSPTPEDPNPASLKALTYGQTALDFTYDADLVTSVALDGPGLLDGKVTWTYNSDFAVEKEQIVASGWTDSEVIYGRDDDRLLTSAGAMTLTPRPDNGLLQATKLGGLSSLREPNAFGEIKGETWTYNGTVMYSNSYEYDGLGRISAITETAEGVQKDMTFEYDDAGRLEAVEENAVLVSEYDYTFDENGSVFELNGARAVHHDLRSGTTVSRVGTYDAQDRLTQYGNLTFTYTANGELATKKQGTQPATTYVYDVFGNLSKVTLPSGEVLTYTHDALGRRVAKQSSVTPTQKNRGYLWGKQLQIVAELDSSNKVVSRFVYATRVNVPDFMISRKLDGTNWKTYRIITNHLGSPRLVVDVNSGTIAQKMTYDEFGNVLSDNRKGFQPFGFAGGLYDPDTKLVRFGARDYDAFTGRWTAKDPIRFAGGDANLYGYVAADPINYFDPMGLWYIDINFTGGHYGAVGTAGVMIGSTGLFVYGGGGAGTPGGGLSIHFSFNDPTTGWNFGASGSALFSAQIGDMLFPEDRNNNLLNATSFMEFGVALGTPSASLTAYYVKNICEF
ncbi:MAG: hypothetical protein MUC50_03765 [Myxococcota bacterium]|nr:hypothetical protein [Myxococcota bacterium]